MPALDELLAGYGAMRKLFNVEDFASGREGS
jgi:hypothetical protein